MGQVSAVLRKVDGSYAHWCPGCRSMHVIPVEEPAGNGARWSFDGNLELPTFNPSVKISSGHFVERRDGHCWCTYEARFGKPSRFKCGICHYFIRAGRIEFCSDSTHALAGQTVPLPPLPPNVID